MVSLLGIAYGVFIFVISIIGAVIAYKVWKNTHNYKVRVRRLTGTNTKVVRDALGKIKTDKQKIQYLKLFFGLKSLLRRPLPYKLPIPSAEVTEYDSTANKMIVEAWYDDTRGFTYIKDPVNVDTLEALKDKDGFRVFPTGHREMFINQLYKRDAAKPKALGEILVYMTPFIALVMILTIFLIFYGKAVAPINEAASSTAGSLKEMQKVNLETVKKMDNLFRNIVHYERGEPLEQVIVAPEAAT